ncbi:hypothetical protein M422DRAFT_266518 [Sphaerobolus stellatus SS14]|uniref:Unplaced genomic scaffold SPHSTscaffold_162, whole genome shotgun sequence n=1 Tax=Sphaerobolus stellatus (strain SS14) TaxID=990650 RepID=A0A0C9URD3_SPHS4|nr:hypothetical protein M422DRAFT_266518 [Sphaerobolus stellatus SS14]
MHLEDSRNRHLKKAAQSRTPVSQGQYITNNVAASHQLPGDIQVPSTNNNGTGRPSKCTRIEGQENQENGQDVSCSETEKSRSKRVKNIEPLKSDSTRDFFNSLQNAFVQNTDVEFDGCYEILSDPHISYQERIKFIAEEYRWKTCEKHRQQACATMKRKRASGPEASQDESIQPPSRSSLLSHPFKSLNSNRPPSRCCLTVGGKENVAPDSDDVSEAEFGNEKKRTKLQSSIQYENASAMFYSLKLRMREKQPDAEQIRMVLEEIWQITGYCFTLKDHRPCKFGRTSRFWCCQDQGRKKKSKKKTGTRDNEGMDRFDCKSSLTISVSRNEASSTRQSITVHLEHEINPKNRSLPFWKHEDLRPLDGSSSQVLEAPQHPTRDGSDSQMGLDDEGQEEEFSLALADQAFMVTAKTFDERFDSYFSKVETFLTQWKYQRQFRDMRFQAQLEQRGRGFFQFIDACDDIKQRMDASGERPNTWESGNIMFFRTPPCCEDST